MSFSHDICSSLLDVYKLKSDFFVLQASIDRVRYYVILRQSAPGLLRSKSSRTQEDKPRLMKIKMGSKALYLERFFKQTAQHVMIKGLSERRTNESIVIAHVHGAVVDHGVQPSNSSDNETELRDHW